MSFYYIWNINWPYLSTKTMSMKGTYLYWILLIKRIFLQFQIKMKKIISFSTLLLTTYSLFIIVVPNAPSWYRYVNHHYHSKKVLMPTISLFRTWYLMSFTKLFFQNVGWYCWKFSNTYCIWNTTQVPPKLARDSKKSNNLSFEKVIINLRLLLIL